MTRATRRSVLRHGALAGFFVALGPPPASAEAGAESPWAGALHARARILAGGYDAASGRYDAAIEIVLDRGFKTYWRHPGESGLPASFDWSGSENLAAAEPLWPAPERFEETGLALYGYADGLVLPLRIEPADAAKPVRLRLGLDYGVCKDICIPVRADIALVIPRQPSVHRGAIEAARLKVPRPVALGGAEPIAILGADRPTAGAKPVLRVGARLAAGERGTLFVEGPDGWYLDAGGAVRAGETGMAAFEVAILERPKKPAPHVPLRLTLVTSAHAIETVIDLDSTGLAR